MTTINGTRLSEAQDSALWTAVQTYRMELTDPEHCELLGLELAARYRARLAEVSKILQPNAVPGCATRIKT